MFSRITPIFLVSTVLLHADPLKYPETKKGDVVETYHGTQIADPYRWLEDDNSAETKAWVEAPRFSYSVAGDMNGDRVNNNDLIYVPNSASELTFDPLVVGSVTYTAAEQAAAFDAFIEQSDYLKSRRGQYTERNGVLFPVLHRFDVSVTQEFYIKIGGKRNTIQLRADILNAANLLNSEWGLGNNFVADRPLTSAGTTSDGIPKYKLATQKLADGTTVLLRDSFVKSKTQFDTWAAQFGIRYIFN